MASTLRGFGRLVTLGCFGMLLFSGCRDAAPQSTTGGTGGTAAPTGSGGAPDTTVEVNLPGATCSGLVQPAAKSPVGLNSSILTVPDDSLADAPPAISGGTLVVLPGDNLAVAADPDRDQIYVVDLSQGATVATIPLTRGDEPGRVLVDGKGRVHALLRGGGALVTVDVQAGVISDRRAVCAAPRGLAHDGASDLIHVACAGGELVSLPADGGAPVRRLSLPSDLRDVVVDGAVLRVSRFRAAEILTVNANGAVIGTDRPAGFRHPETRGGQLFTSSLAWRMVGVPGGGVAMVHQRGVTDEVQHGTSNSYGGTDFCQGIVHTTVSRMFPDGTVQSGHALSDFPLPVDLALSGDGQDVAIISAANTDRVSRRLGGQPSAVHVSPLDRAAHSEEGCLSAGSISPCRGKRCQFDLARPQGQYTAVAFLSDGGVVVQSREPAALTVNGDSPILLSTASRSDAGHSFFHFNAGAGLACATCHAEGNDDGRVWNFACAGARRTQSLQTGIRGTEPFHWDGDEKDFPQLVRDVFTTRMGGPELQPQQVEAMLSWIDRQPRPAKSAPIDTAAVERGRKLFNAADKGNCASCHAGPNLTNGTTVDVGTGGAFQVPSLVGLSSHAPYMHTGCANTLGDRFNTPACGGGDKHGKTSTLASGDLSDLIAYLDTL